MRQKSELRPYQQRIATHLYEHDEALCVVRPGGGKTAATLTAFEELFKAGEIRHALVVAPKRVAQHVWPNEIDEWAHTKDLRYAMLTGMPPQREMILNCMASRSMPDLTIIGLDLVIWLLDRLNPFPDNHSIFDLLIIDEISKLRDPTGQRAKILAKHAHRWKMVWGLSGTLRPNSSQDLFMPARVVTRGKLWGKSFYQWRQQNFYPADFKGYQWKPLPGAEDRLNAEIAPSIVTLREDEYPQIPELSVIIDRVELPERARRVYDDMHRRLMTAIATEHVVAANAAVATGKLAQIANGFIYNEKKAAVAVHDEKRDWLADVIENASGPTLLIYEFVEDLKLMRETVGGDLPYLGDGVSDAAGKQTIADWNAGKLPFLALHPAAGGHGLNLQAGGCDMAWMAPTWSPELWEQTLARLHRPGQTKPVIVRVCVAERTVDQMKMDRSKDKMVAQKAFERYLAAYKTA